MKVFFSIGGCSLFVSAAVASAQVTSTPILDPIGPAEGTSCLSMIEDVATNQCIQASSKPTLGSLYPLGPEFNISDTGLVGIGTTNPGARLHIFGDDCCLAPSLRLESSSPFGTAMGLKNTAGGQEWFLVSLDDGTFGLHDGSTYHWLIDQNGRVGVNTGLAEPVAHLEVRASSGTAVPAVVGRGANHDVGAPDGGLGARFDGGGGDPLVFNSVGGLGLDVTGGFGFYIGGAGLQVAGGDTQFDFDGTEGGHGVVASGGHGQFSGGDGARAVGGDAGFLGGVGLRGTGGNSLIDPFPGGTGVIGVGGTGPVGGNGVVGTAGTGSTNGLGVVANGGFGGTGAKYFLQPHPTDPSKELRFVCLEGSESGTYFRGKGRTVGGRAVIEVPESFRLVSEEDGITVQLTPVGRLATLAVESQNLHEVRVLGSADVEFHYFVNGVRRGFADHEPLHPNTSFVPEYRGEEYASYLPRAVREILVENGILNPDFTPNEATATRLGWRLRDRREARPDRGSHPR